MTDSVKKMILVLSALALLVVSACAPAETSSDSSNDTGETHGLTVIEKHWWEANSSTEETVFEDVKRGDIISESSYGKFKVKSVSDEKIVIGVEGGFVESSDGVIDMYGDRVTKIKLQKGESIEIASTTYDAGARLIISYH